MKEIKDLIVKRKIFERKYSKYNKLMMYIIITIFLIGSFSYRQSEVVYNYIKLIILTSFMLISFVSFIERKNATEIIKQINSIELLDNEIFCLNYDLDKLKKNRKTIDILAYTLNLIAIIAFLFGIILFIKEDINIMYIIQIIILTIFFIIFTLEWIYSKKINTIIRKTEYLIEDNE